MKKLQKSIFILCLLLLVTPLTNAQIAVTGGLTAQQLAEILSGSNITVSNATITGPALGYGSFTSTNGFQFSSGVILSNGEIANAVGPNNDPNTSDNLGGAGTAQMSTLGGASSSDVITLEFDFVVQSAGVQFKYLFASEDYPEFAPPNQPSFNDVFAFYISGPGITGEENIALVPSTLLPVTISNINPVTNSQYYWDNANGNEVQFDGGTVELIAGRSGLTPCQTYHLKLVIADIHNANRNSAVFLKENSFVQENVLGGETQTINSDGVALEGCVDGRFEFEFTETSTQDRTINFTIGGSAVNGVDYSFLDNYITIPAGETTGTVYINAFSDGLNEGAETVSLTYNSGICVGTETVDLTINDAQSIDFSLNGTNLDCFEDNSGEILVNATGGFPPYTYVITNPTGNVTNYSSNPVTGLAAGQYSVQVNDAYGCKAEALVIGGQFNAGTTFLPDGNGVTYEAPLPISGFDAGATITNISQIQQICLTMEHSYLGDLTLRVESPSGQSIILKPGFEGGSCDLGEPIATGPVDGSGSSDITPGTGYEYCFNANPNFGTMAIESNNYTRNYTDALGHSYSDRYLPAGSYVSSDNFSGLLGSQMNGTWKVFVTDNMSLDNGYIFNWYISLIGDLPDTLITLTEPQEISVSGNTINASCGNNNGSVNALISNGSAPYTFLWSNGATTQNLSNIGAGQYILTVTDNSGCTKSETFIINNTSTLDLTSSITNTSCYGGNNGAITITPSGGTGAITTLWSNSSTTNTISDLTAGDYSVTITDQIGCQYSEIVSVGSGVAISVNAVSIGEELCNTTNGSINISVTGGNGSYGYSWSNGTSSEDLSNLNSGTYTVTVTDGLGCTGLGNFTIANNLTGCSNFCYLDITTNSVTNSQCGGANGSINVSLLNAALPVSLLWNNGSTTEDLSLLIPGTYTLNATDANNCSSTQQVVVGNSTNGLAMLSSSITDETCGLNNGAISIQVSGGVNPINYNWSNGSTNQNISGLSEGSYTVSITDASSCSTTETFIINNNTGNLSVTGQVNDAFCGSNNGAITQTITGANGVTNFLWNTGATTQNVSSLAPGNYSCVITDASGCSLTNYYAVGLNSGNVSLDGTLITNEVCNNGLGAINITVSGTSLTYLWSNGATTEDISSLVSGNYSCVITNSQGCSISTGSISVINTPGNLVVSNQAVNPEVCNNNNGSIDVNIYGGQSPYTYLWSNGASTQDITNLSGGTYTLQLNDVNGCIVAHSVLVNENSGTLAITNPVLTHESCIAGTGTNGQGSINLTTTGETTPYNYTWSNGGTTEDITGLTDGTYSVTVTAANGCVLNQSFTILSNGSNLAIASSTITDETCGSGNGAIDITMDNQSGPYSYSWTNGSISQDLQALNGGVYSVTISNSAGCQLTRSFTIANDPGTMDVNGIVINETCGNSNGSINVNVTGGNTPYSYDWSNGATTQDLLSVSEGNYILLVEDLYGCSSNYSASVLNISNGLSLSLNSVTDDVCGQAVGAINVDITGSGPFTYLWSNGATSEDISGLVAGTYTLNATDNTGCSAQLTVNVLNNSGSLAVSFSNTQNENCSNSQGYVDIEVTGSGPFSYLWSNGATTQDIANLSMGTYSVTITDGLSCSIQQSFVISGTSSFTVNESIINSVCNQANGSVDISIVPTSQQVTYSWSNGATTQSVNNLIPGVYTLTVSSPDACQVVENYTITTTDCFYMCNVTSSNLSSGTLYDSGGPTGNYSNFQNCSFLIDPPCADAVTLSFTNVNTFSSLDYLKVYDGPDATGILLGTFSGNVTPPALIANSGKMFITFFSNGSNVSSGFNVSWSTTTFINPPTSVFTVSNINPALNSTVNFTNTDNTATTWAWDVDGNGSTDYTTQNSSHIYTVPGTYNVSLTSTNCIGSTTTSQVITVQGAPSIALSPITSTSATITTCGSTLTHTFTITNNGTGDLIWTGSNGSIPFAPAAGTLTAGSSQLITLNIPAYEIAGVYTLYNAISSNDNLQPVINDTIIITQSVSCMYKMCVNSSSTDQSGNLSDSGGGAGNYSNNQNCSFLIDPACSDYVTLTFSSFLTFNSLDYIRVYDGSSTGGILLGTFSGSVLPPSLTANSGKMFITFNSSATNVSSGFVASWVSTDFSIPPTATFITSNSNPPLNTTVNFTNTDNTSTSWAWDVNGDAITDYTTQNVNHIYTVPGTYIVSFTATNCIGSTTTTQTVIVQGAPLISLNPQTATNVTVSDCGTSTNYSFIITNNGTGDLNWSGTNGLIPLSPANGIITAGNSQTVTMVVPPRDNAGIYTYYNVITSNDNLQPTINDTLIINQTINCNFKMCVNTGSTDLTGTLTDSGGTTGNYSNNQNCSFLIDPVCADSVTLTFSSFLTYNSLDYIRVYDGANTSGILLGTFSGAALPPVLTANSGKMFITFNTSGVNVSSGFVASWSTGLITTPPISSFIHFNEIAGSITSFYADDQNGLTYEWDMENDGTVDYTNANPEHVYTVPGTYDVSLTVTNCFGSSTTIETITVVGPAIINVSPITSTFTIDDCSDVVESTFTITNTGESILDWNASNGQFVLTPSFGSLAPNSSETVTMTLSSFSNAGNYTIENFINSNDPTNPTVLQTVYINQSVDCGGNTMCNVFMSNQSSGTLYDSGGEFGQYMDNENCSFLIQPACNSNITLSLASVEIESGWDYLTIYDGINSSGIMLANLTGSIFSGTYTATSGSMYIEFSSDGSIVQNGFELNWTANGSSEVVGTVIQPCSGPTGSIDQSVVAGNIIGYAWSNGETTEDIFNLTAGLYSCTYTTDLGCTSSNSYLLTGPLFGNSGTVIHSTCTSCTEGSINIEPEILGNTYSWSTGASTADISGLTPGTYTLVLANSDGCDTTLIFDILNTASLNEFEITYEMNVYPNPSNGIFFVDVVMPSQQTSEIIISDMTGKLIEKRELNQSGTYSFDGKQYQNGIYFITLKIGQYSSMKRIIISAN